MVESFYIKYKSFLREAPLSIYSIEDDLFRRVKVGNLMICDAQDWKDRSVSKVFLYTGYKDWMILTDQQSYHVFLKGKIRIIWIGKACNFDVVLKNTNIGSLLNDEGMEYFKTIENRVPRIPTIYARCNKSMYLLDDIHRNYVNEHTFIKGDVMAIKSVAGSGKTTTLLTLSKIHRDKKILYLAFNKSLITEIKSKVKKDKITNLCPRTFDSLLYELYTIVNSQPPKITDLRPQFIHKILPWFTKVKYYTVKKFCCNHFSKFCNDPDTKTMVEYCKNVFGDVKKPLLVKMWESVLSKEITTFESIRKQAYLEGWFTRLDSKYDMIMIDETQDFDLVMLKLLLEQTTLPKLFVGDPKQAIYQFRGCINAFDYLPKNNAMVIEFYSTFRVGDPVCSSIREMFDDCWMISKSKNKTCFTDIFNSDQHYTHLFRTWKALLKKAEITPDVYIYNYDKKITDIRKLHSKLLANPKLSTEDMIDDDLPMFLKSLSLEELNSMLENIDSNVVDMEDSRIKMCTVHSYKGMEDENIEIDNDLKEIEKWDKKKNGVGSVTNDNVFYVAVTRGMKLVKLPTN